MKLVEYFPCHDETEQVRSPLSEKIHNFRARLNTALTKRGGWSAARPMVLYHAGCMDGAVAAYAAWLAGNASARRDDELAIAAPVEAELIACSYGDDLTKLELTGRLVLMVDFSASREVLEKLRESGSDVFIIDHHKTAEEALKNDLDCLFDMDFSGAHLTWAALLSQDNAPELVRYVEDRDLWRFMLSNSKGVNALLYQNAREKGWLRDPRGFRFQAPIDARLLECARVLAKKEQQIAQTQAELAVTVPYFFGYANIPVVNVTTAHSETLHILAQGHAFAAGFSLSSNGDDALHLRLSLRSAQDGTDVGAVAIKIAELINQASDGAWGASGGGHKHAAGVAFKRPLSPLLIFSLILLSPNTHEAMCTAVL